MWVKIESVMMDLIIYVFFYGIIWTVGSFLTDVAEMVEFGKYM